MRTLTHTIAALGLALGTTWVAAATARAGDNNGNFMARIGATVVDPDASADVFAPTGLIAGADADVSTEVVPSLTLTYFFNRNIALELFCCFANHDVDGKGILTGIDLGDTWIFPPALTLQYHFDFMGGMKPYFGAGVQYINFFGEGSGGPGIAGAKLDIDAAFGFTLQAGVDIPLGDGWYLNGDIKKTWLETDAKWTGPGVAVNADVEVDPWIFTVGVGYRFNLSDLVGGN